MNARSLFRMVLWLVLLAPHGLFAQSIKQGLVHGRTSAAISAAQEKHVAMLLHTADPTARLSIHTDRQHVKVQHSADLPQGALASIFQLSGLDLLILQGPPGLAMNRSLNAPPPPVLQNTGDPEQDALNYAAAKAAWVQANPEHYRALTATPADQ